MLCVFNISCTHEQLQKPNNMFSEKVALSKTILNVDRRSRINIKNDDLIITNAWTALRNNPNIINNSHLNIACYNGNLLIVGQTQNEYYKKQINHILQDLDKINTLYNQITLEKPASFSARIKDRFINAKVKSRLLNNANIGPNRIKTITEKQKVYLMGLISPKEEITALRLASTTNGVTQVIKIFDKYQDAL